MQSMQTTPTSNVLIQEYMVKREGECPTTLHIPLLQLYEYFVTSGH